MRIHELLDMPLLVTMMADGYVGMQSHPVEGHTIYNYTHAAQYDRVWNPVTRQCRGLIVDAGGFVIARPFAKFFNYGEHEEAVKYDLATHRKVYPASDLHHALDLDAAAVVTDKADGSLGILYPLDRGGWAIATRGSFTSEQAVRATEMLAGYLRTGFSPKQGLTYLFEIIYPENRIVLDYAGWSGLTLIEALETESGEVVDETRNWTGGSVERLHAETLRAALALEPRPNAEGVVVRMVESGLRLKIKQEDYVALHRIVTGLNERTVWEMTGQGKTVADICIGLPDEFARWVEDIHVGQQFEADHVWYAARDAYEEIKSVLDHGFGFTRKDFALASADEKYAAVRPYLFMLLDGKDVRPAIWRSIKPKGGSGVGRKLLAVSEDTA